MNKRIINVSALILSVIVLAVIAVLSGKWNTATAFDNTTSDTIVISTLSSKEADQKEDITEQILSLFKNKEKELLKQGWLHVVYKTSLLAEVERGTLPNGIGFPSEYVMEDWYLLDSENYVVKAATFMRDVVDGNFLQKSIYFNETWINTTFDDKIEVGRFMPSVDFGYLSIVQASDTKLEKYESSIENNSVTVYEIIADYLGSDVNTQQIVLKLYFDTSTGNLLKSETVLRNIDDTEILDSITEILIMENTQEPSQDVSDYFNEVEK